MEVSLEEDVWRDVWFPATIVEDLGGDLFLVEYNWSGSNDESKLCRVTAVFTLNECVVCDLAISIHASGGVPVSNDVEHDELRETVSLNSTNVIDDITTFTDKQTSIATSMKRAKPANPVNNSKPSKKSKAGITSNDSRLSNGGQSKEASNPAVGQTFDNVENLSGVKKKIGKRGKGVDLKRPTNASAKKKGRLSADSQGLKTVPQVAGDSTLTTTPNIAEKKHVDSPIPVVMGLQSYAVMVSQSKKSKHLTFKSPENVVEPEEPQSGVPLSPKALGNQEKKETVGDTITKKKRGRPLKAQLNNLETSLAVNHQDGDASVKTIADKSGIELPLQQEKCDKPVKGKRGKRRMISLNSPSSPQDVQDSSNQKENGNSDINVDKSLDTVSDDQPLSRWFNGKHSLVTLESAGKNPPEISTSLPIVALGDGQALTFEKRSALWETIESMEVFRLFPQKPHFRPLNDLKESARERHAINKMVDFSGVFEDTRRLRIDHPITEIEDKLETLSELETHGFDTDIIRNRLLELISFKEKCEGLESRSKEVKVNIDDHRVEVQKLDKEIMSIDQKVSDLLEKRDQVSKEKEKSNSEIVGLEGEMYEIEEALCECRCKFDELAAACLV